MLVFGFNATGFPPINETTTSCELFSPPHDSSRRAATMAASHCILVVSPGVFLLSSNLNIANRIHKEHITWKRPKSRLKEEREMIVYLYIWRMVQKRTITQRTESRLLTVYFTTTITLHRKTYTLEISIKILVGHVLQGDICELCTQNLSMKVTHINNTSKINP